MQRRATSAAAYRTPDFLACGALTDARIVTEPETLQLEHPGCARGMERADPPVSTARQICATEEHKGCGFGSPAREECWGSLHFQVGRKRDRELNR
jgi:hypothetical protein